MFPARIHAAMTGLNLADRDIPFYFCKDARKFTKVGGADSVIRSLKELSIPPVLVILDTVNRSLDGSENSDEDMTHYTRCVEDVCREFNCAVVVIHHCGVSGDKPRGHTSLTGTCAAQLKIERASKAPVVSGQPMMVKLEVELMKDGPEGGEEFSWLMPVSVVNEDGEIIADSCYCTEAPKPGPKMTAFIGNTKKALSILQEMLDSAGLDAITYTEWKNRFASMHRGRRDSAVKAFNRAFDALVESGSVKINGINVSLGNTT